MKLDPTVMRTMNRQDYRVLAAVETGMKSHELVPSPLVTSIASLRHGGTSKILSSLLRDKLLSHDRSCGYDGYRLTNSGYDVLALHNLKTRGIVAALGDRIGTGKESDVYLAATPAGRQIVLKFHRLGRTSFRDVKKKRDYFMVNALSKNKKRGAAFRQLPNSWLFLSRTSAVKEYTFMKALHEVHYPTPAPIGHNRHIVVMGLVRGVPLYQLHANRVSAAQAESIYRQSASLAARLAKHGLVHCDLNEFNLMVDLSGIQSVIASDCDDDVGEHYVRHSGMSVETPGALSAHNPLHRHRIDGTGEVVTEAPPEPVEFLDDTDEPKPIVTLIDFPQMVSTRHPNAKELYERDVACLKRFFGKKLRCIVEGDDDDDDEFGGIMPSWEELVRHETIAEDEASAAGASELKKGADGDGDEEASRCLASKAQLRLDQELQASGYSAEDAGRDMELYYYETHRVSGDASRSPADEADGESEEGESSSDEDDDDNSVEKERGGRPRGDNGDYRSDLSSSEEDKDGDEDECPALQVVDKDEAETTMSRQNWADAEAKARARVQRHLLEGKKKGRTKGAFRRGNKNKTYVKGKRVMNDTDF